jgi:isopentenyl diphosphate isomerase/L-lactate dehydrogenase-like FMN-dependent dehydrogenase
LAPAMDSTAAVVETIEALKKEFVTTMFLLSASNVDDLHLNDSLVVSED